MSIQHACGNWVLKQPASLAPGNWADPGRRKDGGAVLSQSLEGTPADFYCFAYSVVEQTIARLERNGWLNHAIRIAESVPR